MTLYWSEARMALEALDGPMDWQDNDYPPETLVLSMLPGQEDDPEFVTTMRSLVIARTLRFAGSPVDQMPERQPQGNAGRAGGEGTGTAGAGCKEGRDEATSEGGEGQDVEEDGGDRGVGREDTEGRSTDCEGGKVRSAGAGAEECGTGCEGAKNQNASCKGTEAQPSTSEAEQRFERNYLGAQVMASDEDAHTEEDEDLFEEYAWEEYLQGLIADLGTLYQQAGSTLNITIEQCDQIVMG